MPMTIRIASLQRYPVKGLSPEPAARLIRKRQAAEKARQRRAREEAAERERQARQYCVGEVAGVRRQLPGEARPGHSGADGCR